MEPSLDYPDYGTIETIKIIDKDTFYQGGKTISARIHHIDYRTDRNTLERIAEIIQELHDDASKIDVGFKIVETKNGKQHGYFVLRVNYTTVVR